METRLEKNLDDVADRADDDALVALAVAHAAALAVARAAAARADYTDTH